MKNRYLISILVVIAAAIGIISYKVELPSFHTTKITLPKNYTWSFTGQSFITTFNDAFTPIEGARNTHACLAGNDESCFLITVRSGNYAGYFNAFRIENFKKMMTFSGSEVSQDDLNAQLKAGFTEVLSIHGVDGATWHLVDIGMEAQHLYVERPWGTLIITDMLGLK